MHIYSLHYEQDAQTLSLLSHASESTGMGYANARL